MCQVKINGYWDGQPIWREITAAERLQAALTEVEQERKDKDHKHE